MTSYFLPSPYRAETAIANTIRGYLSHPDEARRLLRSLYETEADLLLDYNEKTLTIKLRHMATPCADKVIEKLCD